MTKAKRYNTVSLDNLSNAVQQDSNIEISNFDEMNATDITIIKRDGRKEQYKPEKMKAVCMWAVDNKEWLADELIRDTTIKLHKEINIKDMFNQLIVTAVNKISMLYPHWEDIAAKLQLMSYYKEIHNMSNMNEYPAMSAIIKRGLDHKLYSKEYCSTYSDEDLKEIDTMIVPERDLLFNYKGIVSYVTRYCLNYTKTKKLELPQHSYMRIAMSLMMNESDRLTKIKDLYDNVSKHNYTCATPIVMNALTQGQQLSSCVLSTVADDSHSILDTGKNLGIYSKFKGGTALDISEIRAQGGFIEGTRGTSSGPVPFMKFYESIMKSFNQGGLRPGSLCVYFSWWHLNVNDLLSLKSNGGTDENRARGLQYGMKINQLFIDAVLNDEDIVLFDPKDARSLLGKTGEAFNTEYEVLKNKSGIRKKTLPARELCEKLMKERSESGNIYLFHDENVNNATLLNRYIGSSNLCLAGNTLVRTTDGQKELKDIEIGDMVLSMNTDTNEIDYKLVTDSAMTNQKATVLRITDDDGFSITCTPEHKIWTKNRGYVMAKDLKEDDELTTM